MASLYETPSKATCFISILTRNYLPVPHAVTKSPDGATHELKDLEVFEVSLVDRPANKRPFLMIKSAEPTMPKGQELTTDENGNLISTTAKAGFSAGSKKKIKASLAAAAKKIGTLMAAIDDADDEESFMKKVSAMAGAFGGGKPKPKDDDAKKSDDVPEVSVVELSPVAPAALDALETSLTPEPVAPVDKAAAAKLDAALGQIETLTKATHTLTRVVKHQSSPRPATQVAGAGETPVAKSDDKNVWKTDMNSSDPDPDEMFV